jgi:hypothetical protein
LSTNMGVGDKKSENNPREGQQIAEGANGKTLSAQTSNLTYSNTNENSASKSLATLGHGNITVGGVQLERDGVLTDAGKSEGSVLIGINRNTEETEKTLWDSSQSQTVDATLDHRLLSKDGINSIKNDFVDTAEFGQDIARATNAVKKNENLNITDFWTTLDNNTKATQIKNELVRDPANAEILEGLKSENPDQFSKAFVQLGELAQEKFGISSEEFGEIFLYDGNKTTSTSLGNTIFEDTKGGLVTDKNNIEAGNIFVNANGAVKTELVNTLGHETVELLTFVKNESNDATQEAQATAFGSQFSDRVNQAAGGDLDSSTGSDFSRSLNSSWSVVNGTVHANNVGNSNTDNRRVKIEEAETLDRYRAKIDQSTQLSSDEKRIAHVQLNALTCAAIECADGIPREDPRYAQLSELQALGEELNAQGTSLKSVLGDEANEQFEHGLMDGFNERLTRHDEGITRTGGAIQATSGAAGMAGGAAIATAGALACPATGLSCFAVPAGGGLIYISKNEGEEGLNKLLGDYSHTEGQAVLDSFSVAKHQGDNNPLLDLTVKAAENTAMLVTGNFGGKYLNKVLDKVDSASAPSVDAKVLDDVPNKVNSNSNVDAEMVGQSELKVSTTRPELENLLKKENIQLKEGWDIDTVYEDILKVPKGQRPDPSKYMDAKYVDEHLAHFDGGVTKIKANPPKGTEGPPGGTFVMSTKDADRMIQEANGDIGKLEELLSLPKGSLGNSPVRVDIPSPKGLRMPSGNELGANSQWVPGGKTGGGIKEATIDPAPPTDYSVKNVF